jgi:hypothetical protein
MGSTSDVASSSFPMTSTNSSSLMRTSIAKCNGDDDDLKDSDDGIIWSEDDAPNHASAIVSALRMATACDEDNDRMVIGSYNDDSDVSSVPAVGTQRPAVKRWTTGKSAATQGQKRSVSASRVMDDIESVTSDVSDPETCGKFMNGRISCGMLTCFSFQDISCCEEA